MSLFSSCFGTKTLSPKICRKFSEVVTAEVGGEAAITTNSKQAKLQEIKKIVSGIFLTKDVNVKDVRAGLLHALEVIQDSMNNAGHETEVNKVDLGPAAKAIYNAILAGKNVTAQIDGGPVPADYEKLKALIEIICTHNNVQLSGDRKLTFFRWFDGEACYTKTAKELRTYLDTFTLDANQFCVRFDETTGLTKTNLFGTLIEANAKANTVRVISENRLSKPLSEMTVWDNFGAPYVTAGGVHTTIQFGQADKPEKARAEQVGTLVEKQKYAKYELSFDKSEVDYAWKTILKLVLEKNIAMAHCLLPTGNNQVSDGKYRVYIHVPVTDEDIANFTAMEQKILAEKMAKGSKSGDQTEGGGPSNATLATVDVEGRFRTKLNVTTFQMEDGKFKMENGKKIVDKQGSLLADAKLVKAGSTVTFHYPVASQSANT